MRVHHKYFGSGIALSQRHGGAELLVDFDCGIRLWVERKALVLFREKRQKFKPSKKGDAKSRKIVEALRMGIVPYFATKHFTFGRKEEIEQIKEAFFHFNEKGGGCIIIEGEYGAGKTHLLDYIQTWALEEGYGVARCELDAQELSPSKPKRIYRALVHSLKYLKEGREYKGQDILEELKEKGLEKPHIFFSRAFEVMKKEKTLFMLWDWISGEPLSREYLDWARAWRLPVLLDHAPAVDIYCYLLSGWASLLERLGAKAFLMIIDEAETLSHLIWRDKEVGIHFFRGLFSLCKNEPALLSFELSNQTLFGLGRMDKNGLLHSAVRPTPYLYKIPSRIILLIASTPSEGCSGMLNFEGAKKIFLPPLSQKDLKELFYAIVEVYKKAFSFPIKDEEKERLTLSLLSYKMQNIRHFIKKGVESMDMLRHYGSN